MIFARLGQATHAEFHDIRPPVSNFQLVDSLLPDDDYSAVRRLFSLARRSNGQTLIIEEIQPAGAVADEVDELLSLFPGYQCSGLKRLTFWKRPCSAVPEMEHLTDEDIIGYAIIKQDLVPGQCPRWHIFESVFQKYAHEHNCVPGEAIFTVRCGNREYRLRGVMYCQQNGLNKACAQVALRSLLSRIVLDQDINYSHINCMARQGGPVLVPGKGLNTNQIRTVLDSYRVKYDDLDYEVANTMTLPYSRILYAGIENGLGGLMGFEFSGAGAHGEKHIIPFYGHTFNQDTWVPRASLAYFHIGDNTRYISSEEWMSSFIGHDDNFGCNYCVPRRFLEPSQVKYVVALRPPDTAYGAVFAEAIAVDCLYSTVNDLQHENNYWIRRLIHHIMHQDVVLRTLYVTRDQYVKHLQESQDWQGHSEKTGILKKYSHALPEHLWMVEVSIPELFPANYRKLGEIILDACVSLDPYPPQEPLWVIARLPGLYLINQSLIQGPATFIPLDSAIESHIPVYHGLSSNGAT